jgi:hypothetical protein
VRSAYTHFCVPTTHLSGKWRIEDVTSALFFVIGKIKKILVRRVNETELAGYEPDG